MTLKDLLQSNWFLLLEAFALTTVAEGILTYYIQKRSWNRQTKLDLYKRKYDEGIKFLDELSELIGNRLFFLQKLLWAINDNDTERIANIEKAYFPIVDAWNNRYYKNRNKIRLLVNEGSADSFLSYADDNKGDAPNSLHYKFVIAHRKVMASKTDRPILSPAGEKVRYLNYACSAFLENVTSEFTRRAEKLELLDEKDLKDNFSRA
jgi:hypothetical protein